jgi:hypothetical protein
VVDAIKSEQNVRVRAVHFAIAALASQQASRVQHTFSKLYPRQPKEGEKK